MLELWTTPSTWISLATLSALEIVLGIDNIVFISILSGKLPAAQQKRARRTGLLVALVTRVGLLLMITWVMGLTATLFVAFGVDIAGRDLVTLGGGLFLVGKATYEIYDSLEVEHDEHGRAAGGGSSFGLIVLQIVVLDLVFSLDSVITAVGMVQQLPIMVTAVILAVGVMLLFADAIGNFVNQHPSVKVLALSFLIMVGVLLIAESFDQHIPKGYVYFAMAFSLGVELVNMRVRKARRRPVKLHSRYEGGDAKSAGA